MFAAIVADYERDNNVPATEIAAALAKMSRGGKPLLLAKSEREVAAAPERTREPAAPRLYEKTHSKRNDIPTASAPVPTSEKRARPQQAGFATYRVEVGHGNGIKPGNIVGAVANESGLDATQIGRIEILETHSLIELPAGLPKKILTHLQTVQVGGRPLRIREGGEMPPLRSWARAKAAPPDTPGIAAARPHAAATAKKPRYISKAERAGGPPKPVRRKAKPA
jgi:ATP-dependent RNA helicase DeaD